MSVTVTPLQISSLVVTPLRVGVAPSPSDHGALAGLGDDDHPQYLDEARGDTRYAATVHTHAVTDLTPFAAEADYLLDIPLVDTSEYGNGEQAGFQYCASSHVWENGPPGQESYTDHVMSWGWNVKAPTIPAIAGEPGVCSTIETKFWGGRGTGGAAFQWEWQVRGIRPDGTQFRPLEIDAEMNGDTVGAGFRCGIVWVGPETPPETLTTHMTFAVRPRAHEDLNHGICKIAVPDTMVSGARALDVEFDAVTDKAQVGLRIFGNTNWNLVGQFVNIGAGSAQFDLGVSAAAPAFFHFFRGGGHEWSAGKNAADHFEIAASSALNGSPALTIDKTTQQTAFHAPPKLPGYTVAALPSAATAGAGALAYVTDAAGGPTLACADGTNWRVIAALGAVVS